ncbi:hypothetical protein Poli38472_008505 [Pythium oligandrum]|uniref:Uncharacterized protein n=1 Tax=Pythium oligandrum TaxID=41045 RepID=A0A8K1C497_PYTOL|nr:hypothetical protein Poli38472_008505 [Pythium oligandrum]|eukprot:TMW55857.1 hypothetical protein Poli38472_008505 [Pythium oligandrum]
MMNGMNNSGKMYLTARAFATLRSDTVQSIERAEVTVRNALDAVLRQHGDLTCDPENEREQALRAAVTQHVADAFALIGPEWHYDVISRVRKVNDDEACALSATKRPAKRFMREKDVATFELTVYDRLLLARESLEHAIAKDVFDFMGEHVSKADSLYWEIVKCVQGEFGKVRANWLASVMTHTIVVADGWKLPTSWMVSHVEVTQLSQESQDVASLKSPTEPSSAVDSYQDMWATYVDSENKEDSDFDIGKSEGCDGATGDDMRLCDEAYGLNKFNEVDEVMMVMRDLKVKEEDKDEEHDKRVGTSQGAYDRDTEKMKKLEKIDMSVDDAVAAVAARSDHFEAMVVRTIDTTLAAHGLGIRNDVDAVFSRCEDALLSLRESLVASTLEILQTVVSEWGWDVLMAVEAKEKMTVAVVVETTQPTQATPAGDASQKNEAAHVTSVPLVLSVPKVSPVVPEVNVMVSSLTLSESQITPSSSSAAVVLDDEDVSTPPSITNAKQQKKSACSNVMETEQDVTTHSRRSSSTSTHFSEGSLMRSTQSTQSSSSPCILSPVSSQSNQSAPQ